MKSKMILRYIFAFIFTIFMTGIADVTKETEIIFPEILAILIGAWVLDRQPWQVTPVKMVLLMTMSAFVGIGLSSLAIPTLGKVAIGYGFTAIFLTLFDSTMVPMISACILPILLGTTSLIYPLSVMVMVLLIVIVQHILGLTHLRTPLPKTSFTWIGNRKEGTTKSQIIFWGLRFLLFMILACVPILTKQYYFIAPPLIVAFTEYTNPDFPLRQKPIKTIILMGLCALCGMTCRYLINIKLQLPLTVAAAVAVLLVFLLYEFFHIQFPPTGAIALLPMILPEAGILWYPIKATVGIALLILAAYFIPLHKIAWRHNQDS